MQVKAAARVPSDRDDLLHRFLKVLSTFYKSQQMQIFTAATFWRTIDIATRLIRRVFVWDLQKTGNKIVD